MKRIALLLITASGLAGVASAQMPKLDSTPGKWSYSTRTEIPGMGSIPMSFEQCVTQKDIFLCGKIPALIDVFLRNALLKAHRYAAHARYVSARAVAPFAWRTVELGHLRGCDPRESTGGDQK